MQQTGKSQITLGQPGFIGIHFPRVIDPACNKYHIRALCPFLDFLAGIFRGSQKEARGSWLEARARRLAK